MTFRFSVCSQALLGYYILNKINMEHILNEKQLSIPNLGFKKLAIRFSHSHSL